MSRGRSKEGGFLIEMYTGPCRRGKAKPIRTKSSFLRAQIGISRAYSFSLDGGRRILSSTLQLVFERILKPEDPYMISWSLSSSPRMSITLHHDRTTPRRVMVRDTCIASQIIITPITTPTAPTPAAAQPVAMEFRLAPPVCDVVALATASALARTTLFTAD